MLFRALLKEAGITRRELGKRMGVARETASRWGTNPPRYALAYLEVLGELRRLHKSIRKAVQDSEDTYF